METLPTKQSLNIPRLRTVNDILGTLHFDYSTQKRNLAYLIQFKEFLDKIYTKYSINKSIERMFLYNILRITSDIIEHLLYCEALERGFVVTRSRGAKVSNLINFAKSKGIISKEVSLDAQEIINWRNKLHPDKQEGLHVKVPDSTLLLTINIVDRLITDINRSRADPAQIRVNPYEDAKGNCLYCQSLLVDNGDYCPACLKVRYF